MAAAGPLREAIAAARGWDEIRPVLERAEKEIAQTDAHSWIALAESFDDRLAAWSEVKEPALYDAMLSICDRVLALVPDAARAWFLKGRVFAALARNNDAIDAFKRALAACRPEDRRTCEARLANLLARTGRHDEAVVAYRALAEAEPGDRRTLKKLSFLLNALGRTSEALNVERRLLSLTGNNGHRGSIGRILLGLGRAAEALDALDEALIAEPKDPGLWTTRAAALCALGRHADALKSCDEAKRRKRSHWDAWIEKARTLQAMGRHDAAVAAIDEALSKIDAAIGPKRKVRPQDFEEKIRVLEAAGRHQAALDVIDFLMDRSGVFRRDAASWADRARLLSALGRDAEALESLDRAIAIDPLRAGRAHWFDPHQVHAALWNDRGLILERLGRTAGAVDSFSEGLKESGEAAAMLLNRARCLSALGKNTEARSDMERAERLIGPMGVAEPRRHMPHHYLDLDAIFVFD